MPPAFLIFFKKLLWLFGIFCGSVKILIICLISVKSAIEILIKIASNL